MDRKVLAVLVLAVVNLVAIAANLMGRSHDGNGPPTHRLPLDRRHAVTEPSEAQAIPWRALHDGTLEIPTSDGRPVEGATLEAGE